MRSARWLLLMALLAVPALACGPFFDDAHHGQEDHDLCRTLEEFYLRVMGIAASPAQQRQRSDEAQAEAERCEAGERWTEARAAWLRCLADAPGIRQRAMRDRIDLLPLVGSTIPVADWQTYTALNDGEHGEELMRFAAAATRPILGVAARVSLAWTLLRLGEVELAQEQLAAAQRLMPGSIKSDEVDFLLTIAPVFAGIKGNGRINHPREALEAIQSWMAGHPRSPRLAQARGWQAYLLWHHRAIAWEGQPNGLLAAVRIWQDQVADPGSRELFGEAVASLRLAYRVLGGRPPAWTYGDARHGVALVWHAITDRRLDDMASLEELILAGPGAGALPAVVPDARGQAALAEACLRTGRRAEARDLARRALAAIGDQGSRRLLIRLLTEDGLPDEAAALLADMPADQPLALRDALVRIGAAHEQRHDWAKALDCYTRAGSTLDVLILSDGEIPLDAFVTIWRSAPSFITRVDEPQGWGEEGRVAGYDWKPELGRRLAKRLVRAGRTAEALPLFAPDRRVLAQRLLDLEAALAAATPEQRADHLLALGRFWYGQGRLLVFNDRHWHQWALSHYAPPDAADPRPPTAEALAQRQRCIAELESMTVYQRAFPLFLELADRHPFHPGAPEALYLAAHCRYWLSGNCYLKYCTYWRERAARDAFWAQGDALLRRLAQWYPLHPLVFDAKVQRALWGVRPPGR